MAAAREPQGPAPAPAVQRIRVQYAKRGPMRFTSTRDFQRALERALRRANVPMAYSGGFHPHPKISYANAAPTGTASEAEYVELLLSESVEPEAFAAELNQALPTGLDVVRAVEAEGAALADSLEGSQWLLDFHGANDPDLATQLQMAARAFLAKDAVSVTRMMKKGPRDVDVREPVLALAVANVEVTTVVRHTTPTIRPTEIWRALSVGLEHELPQPVSTRVAQGLLVEQPPGWSVTNPLACRP